MPWCSRLTPQRRGSVGGTKAGGDHAGPGDRGEQAPCDGRHRRRRRRRAPGGRTAGRRTIDRAGGRPGRLRRRGDRQRGLPGRLDGRGQGAAAAPRGQLACHAGLAVLQRAVGRSPAPVGPDRAGRADGGADRCTRPRDLSGPAQPRAAAHGRTCRRRRGAGALRRLPQLVADPKLGPAGSRPSCPNRCRAPRRLRCRSASRRRPQPAYGVPCRAWRAGWTRSSSPSSRPGRRPRRSAGSSCPGR